MPIFGKNPRQCFELFREHVASLVAATLPTQEQIAVSVAETSDERATLAFRPGPAALSTFAGTLHLFVGQLLGTEREKRRQYRLRTRKYWYRLQESAQGDALIRWEYDPDVLPRCRHHIQLRPARLPVAGQDLDLNRLHLPTGWVTIEEVIRFLITELDVKPPCGGDWGKKLEDSERHFFEEFTGKRYKPT